MRNHIFTVLRRTAAQSNFVEYDAPTLEPLGLYTEKSGDEIVNQLYCFEDKGGRQVALRPEMTPSVARMVGAKASALKKPVKWFSIGEFFRYERQQKGRLRSFYQYNVDIYGEPGVGADVELIFTAISSLRAFGLTETDFKLRLSDRIIWNLWLSDFGISEEEMPALLSFIDKWDKMDDAKKAEQLAQLLGDRADDFASRLAQFFAINDISGLRVFAESCGKELSAGWTDRLDAWQSLLENLISLGVGGFIEIDFKIVRGLAYYTGFVFEAFDAEQTSRALAGGGRYDGLIKKLGGADTPATGFAMGDVTLRNLLEEKGILPSYIQKPYVFCVIGGEGERTVALQDIARLRSSNVSVEYPLKSVGMGKQFKQAGSVGADLCLIYGSEEVEADAVKLRVMADGSEKLVERKSLLSEVIKFLETGEL